MQSRGGPPEVKQEEEVNVSGGSVTTVADVVDTVKCSGSDLSQDRVTGRQAKLCELLERKGCKGDVYHSLGHQADPAANCRRGRSRVVVEGLNVMCRRASLLLHVDLFVRLQSRSGLGCRSGHSRADVEMRLENRWTAANKMQHAGGHAPNITLHNFFYLAVGPGDVVPRGRSSCHQSPSVVKPAHRWSRLLLGR